MWIIHADDARQVQWAQIQYRAPADRVLADQWMRNRWERREIALAFMLHPQLRVTSIAGIDQGSAEGVFHFQVGNGLLGARRQRLVSGDGVDPGGMSALGWILHGTQNRAMIGLGRKNQVAVPGNKTDKGLLRFGFSIIHAQL
ncbi:hypothetical protein D9M71_743780 [compost metagenome]